MENQTLPSIPPVSPPPPLPQPKKFSVLPITLILLPFIATLALIGYFYYQNQNLKQQLGNQTATPTPSISSDQQSSQPQTKWAYTSESKLYLYDSATQQNQPLDPTAGPTNQYRQPQFLSADLLSYVNCRYQNTEPASPYSCSIVKHNLKTNQKDTVVTLQSYPNENNYPIGGYFNAYSWNKDQTKVAYLAFTKTDTPTNNASEQLDLHFFDPKSKLDVLIDSFTPTSGRGGMLDDHNKIRFSPDGTHLLLTATFFYPGDSPTTIIYNISASPTKVWTSNAPLTTFSNWISPNTVIAKQVFGSTGSLVSFSPTQANPTTLLTQFLGYELTTVDANTVAYYEINPLPSTGLLLKSFNLNTKSTTDLGQNLRPIKPLNPKHLAVYTFRSCTQDECGMDIFNGVLPDGLGILNLTSKELTKLAIPSFPYYSEVDIINY